MDKEFDINDSDASATIMRRGWIEITKTGDGGPLAAAEFTVFALDCKTVIRKGTTGADGKLTLSIICPGFGQRGIEGKFIAIK